MFWGGLVGFVRMLPCVAVRNDPKRSNKRFWLWHRDKDLSIESKHRPTAIVATPGEELESETRDGCEARAAKTKVLPKLVIDFNRLRNSVDIPNIKQTQTNTHSKMKIPIETCKITDSNNTHTHTQINAHKHKTKHAEIKRY